MKIAIIGAGFTGLSAGLKLSKTGHTITIFERDDHPGGLAVGFRAPKWDWSLEKHYHHFFTNDTTILDLAKEVKHPIIIRRPMTSVYVEGKTYQMDSPLKVLSFPLLSPIDRFRMGASLAFFRFNPFWKSLEKFNTTSALPKIMGNKAYKMIWETQMNSKFGSFSNDISLAWFWARIKKRTSSLAYPQGGFLDLAEHLQKEIENNGGTFFYNSEVVNISSKENPQATVKQNSSTTKYEFDKIIVTLPSFPFVKIAESLPAWYKNNLLTLKGLGTINVVLRLKKDFFKDNTYWLSECDPKSPIMAIVEHTHFIDKKNYNNESLLYIGKYLPAHHKYFSLSDNDLLSEYHPYLEHIHRGYKKDIIQMHVFKAPFAQPIITTNYSQIIPPFETPLKNVYLANIQQVYPWDRGTNYAVELGIKVAKIIDNTQT